MAVILSVVFGFTSSIPAADSPIIPAPSALQLSSSVKSHWKIPDRSGYITEAQEFSAFETAVISNLFARTLMTDVAEVHLFQLPDGNKDLEELGVLELVFWNLAAEKVYHRKETVGARSFLELGANGTLEFARAFGFDPENDFDDNVLYVAISRKLLKKPIKENSYERWSLYALSPNGTVGPVMQRKIQGISPFETRAVATTSKGWYFLLQKDKDGLRIKRPIFSN